ncbi:type VI secretion system protein TssL, long form [Afifella marina]|uniref:Type VI secretion system protein ImpK n=1 Tax=Afifella marina DSM 2698 TaxID=1120955 RepID=A0A1G5MMY9_AFIMA|nr:type VI secretion system protein TssL, long form [Afifella marina]MBK1623978.1 type VI secretion system protein TssL [Afifella marina DSM 2698]MBK1627106.1 type VI secretion system protein TssL [Afifella marina]MBK5918865.1 cell envelope biogenesis protein OmpA [Afifella marina]RAI22531.1 cell envelope biogenesis protein OmpA [Afifella marina DSM 2698]SCZ26463.1 type VI secretion system protein ImpK [Afifella marina DSM 2698]
MSDLPSPGDPNDANAEPSRTGTQDDMAFDDILASGKEAGASVEPRPATGWSAAAIMRDFRFGGEEVPVLVASAAPLLNLAHELRQRTKAPDMDEMRGAVIDAVRRYERDLASARISPERARAAHYVVCATIDDVILSKPWSERMGWARSGLVSTFHMDVTGGDRVFDLLDHFHQSPGANKDLLLLIYLCLSLAFEGRTRVSPRGTLELERIRESLYRTLLGQYGVFERELSPHWRGVVARHKPLRTATVLWTLLACLVLALGLSYFLFTLWLNQDSDVTARRLADLPPSEAPSLAAIAYRSEPEMPPEVDKEPPAKEEPVTRTAVVEQPEPPEEPTRLDNLLAFLQPEVDAGLVTLSDANGRLRVRIANSGLFETGSADVNPDFRGLIERIGGALSSEGFKAIVVGYTDDVPIRTVQFPSNWDLSEARAKAVGDILALYTGPDAITTEGRADSDPLASNDTPEGREMNRRTEILVMTDAAARLNQTSSGTPAQEGAPPIAPSDQPEVPAPAALEGGDKTQ